MWVLGVKFTNQTKIVAYEYVLLCSLISVFVHSIINPVDEWVHPSVVSIVILLSTPLPPAD